MNKQLPGRQPKNAYDDRESNVKEPFLPQLHMEMTLPFRKRTQGKGVLHFMRRRHKYPKRFRFGVVRLVTWVGTRGATERERRGRARKNIKRYLPPPPPHSGTTERRRLLNGAWRRRREVRPNKPSYLTSSLFPGQFQIQEDGTNRRSQSGGGRGCFFGSPCPPPICVIQVSEPIPSSSLPPPPPAPLCHAEFAKADPKK